MEQRELTPLYSRLLVRLIRPFPNWDFFFIKSLRQRAADLLQLQPGSRVLDAGCGPGGTFPYLVKRVGPQGEVVGVELSPETARNTRRRIQANQWNNVELLVWDAKTVKLTGKFDGLVMFAAPDVYASAEAVANLFPHLKTGARVVVFGGKLSSHRLGGVFNGFFRAVMKLSFSSTPALGYDPLCELRDRVESFQMQEFLFGCMFLAWGSVRSSGMPDTSSLIQRMYAAFNRRDIDGVLSHMSATVDWPKASEGGRVIGKDEIRAYWMRQWAEFDPHVEPMEIIDREHGKTEVRVHQLVKNLNGEVLADHEVWHIYTIVNGLIERMDIKADESGFGPPHAG